MTPPRTSYPKPRPPYCRSCPISKRSAGCSSPWRSADIIAQGRQIYADQCAACHGADLEGQPDWRTPLASGRLPAPPHDESGHTWHHPDEVLFRIVKEGTAAVVGGGYESDMPGFADVLSDAEMELGSNFHKHRTRLVLAHILRCHIRPVETEGGNPDLLCGGNCWVQSWQSGSSAHENRKLLVMGGCECCSINAAWHSTSSKLRNPMLCTATAIVAPNKINSILFWRNTRDYR